MKKILKILGIGFLALMAVTLFSNILNTPDFFGGSSPRPAAVQSTLPPLEDTLRTPAPGEVTNYYTKRRIETMATIISNALPHIDVEWRYDNQNGYVFYDLIAPEFSPEFIQNAKDDYGTCLSDWNRVVRDVCDVQSSAQKYFVDMEDETLVIVDILNPRNTDEVWLSVANGIAGYDVVNGIDLLNNPEG